MRDVIPLLLSPIAVATCPPKAAKAPEAAAPKAQAKVDASGARVLYVEDRS